MNTPNIQITFSIVSHGQGDLIVNLLRDIRQSRISQYEIILTLNLHEDEGYINEFSDLPIKVIRNNEIKGFGANHNSAFDVSAGSYFIVVNPDIRLIDFDISPVLEFFESGSSVGACAPVVVSSKRTIEDSVRYYPTTLLLIKRIIRRLLKLNNAPDYVWTDSPIKVDWAAGMFVIFKREAFKSVKGFDERYFMYYEDADICKRMKHKGWNVFLHPKFTVIHDAQRASWKSLRHLKWHVSSILRVLFV